MTKMKIELRHGPHKHTNRDVETYVKNMLNHPNERIKDVRKPGGHTASAIYLTFDKGKWDKGELDRLARSVARNVESAGYADNVRVADWRIEVEPGWHHFCNDCDREWSGRHTDICPQCGSAEVDIV